MALAKAGIGSTLKIGAAASPFSPVTIPLVGDISGPKLAQNLYDVTSQDSVGGFKQVAPGLTDPGTLDCTGYYDANDTTQDLMLTIFNSRERRYFEINSALSNPAKKLHFMGYISGIEFNHPVDGIQSFNLTIAIDGAVTKA